VKRTLACLMLVGLAAVPSVALAQATPQQPGWFAATLRPAATVFDLQLGLGEQWAHGASLDLQSSFVVRGALTVGRRMFLSQDLPLAIAFGAVLTFPVNDAPSDLLQVMLRAGLGFAVHPLLEVDVAGLVGPSMEFFHDAYFGDGARIGLVAGARLAFHVMLAETPDTPYVVLGATGLGAITSPDYLSWSVSVGIGGALERVERHQQ
jgi:hypothetical protein